MDNALVVVRGVLLTVIAFGLMVFVHELGHFLAAKLIRVRVDRFSFGFGPKLIGRTWGQTEYMISAVPLGGYVKLGGGDEGEEATGAPDEYVSKTPGQRTLVLVAGPLFSVLFGIPLAMGMFIVGRQTPASQVSHVAVGSPAWEAGVHIGDRVKAIGGRSVQSFEEVRQAVAETAYNAPLPLTVERDGKDVTLRFTRPKGLPLGVSCIFLETRIKETEPNTPAAAAGLRKGDRVLAVNGKRLRGWFDFRRHVLASPEHPVSLLIERDGKTLTVTATPKGIEVPDPGFTIRLLAEVGFVRKGFPADGKLQVGDHITAVNGKPVAGWWEIEDAVVEGPPAVTLDVQRGEDRVLIPLSNDAAQMTESLSAALKAVAKGKLTVELARGEGMVLADTLGIVPRPVYEIVGVHRQAEPLLQPGDLVTRARGTDLADAIPEQAVYEALDDMLSRLGDRKAEVEIGVLRRTAELVVRPQLTLRGIAWAVGSIETDLAVTLQPGTRTVGQLGVVPTAVEMLQKTSILGSIVPALRRTADISTFAFRVIAKLFQRDVPLSDLMGPAGIVQVTYISATRGWADLFWLIHLITVNIGVFNLIPVPPLDGGRIVMLAYEKVRGKQPSRKVQEAIIMAGFVLVVLIFIVATFNDVRRMFF